MEINKKDKRILYELDINSSQSLGQIGKNVKLPKTVVLYRINSLQKRGILKKCYAFVNFTKLGFTQYKVYLKFQFLIPKKEREIINYLSNRKNIIWVTSCRGEWDISVTIIAKDIVEFDLILKEIIDSYGKFILNKEVLLVSYSPLFSRNYLLPEKQKKDFIYMSQIENIKIDRTESNILKILSNDSRIPILSIMDKLNLSRDVISYRIKKLEKNGIILCYRSLIDLEKINHHLYKIMFRLGNFSSDKELKLISYCKSIANIVQYIRLVGSWDTEIEVEIENENELYNLINNLRGEFSDLIRDFAVLHITEEHKLNYYPL